MILLASLRSDKWTAWPEHVVDFIGPGSEAEVIALAQEQEDRKSVV